METRKLAAIMFTDIVGYSALMSKDEKLAMEVLEKNRAIHKKAIGQYNGQFIKEIGDGTLSIFQSSLAAVNCAIEINQACCKEKDFRVRIGIHIGDIIFRDNDVFGDGVNIASRIESSGEPDGIYFSDRVYEDIKNKTDIKAEFIGEKQLKNIDHPVKVYALRDNVIDHKSERESHSHRSSRVSSRKYLVSMILLLAVIAALTTTYLVGNQKGRKLDPNLIAVAVFENQTGNKQLDPVGRMASDWITQGISETGLVSVIPSSQLKTEEDVHGNMNAIRSLANETGAQMIITGVYYQHGNKLQFHANLVDAGNEKIINAIDPVEGKVDDPLAPIEVLRQKVLGALAANFDEEFQDYSDRKLKPPLFDAYKESLAGVDYFWESEYEKAIECFTRAYDMDTTYMLPLVLTYHSYMNKNNHHKADSISSIIQKHINLLSVSERYIYDYLNTLRSGDLEMAFKKAKLSGKYFLPHRYNSGYAALLANYPFQAIEILSKLDPDYKLFPNWYPGVMSMAYHMTGDYQKELEIARDGLSSNPELYSAFYAELRALAALGKMDDINDLLAESLKLPLYKRQGWSPGYPGWLMLMTAQELRAQGYSEDADKVIDRSIKWFLEHTEVEDQSYLATAYYVAEQCDESEKLFTELLQKDPENIEYQGYLGAIAARKGNVQKAEEISDALGRVNQVGSHGLNIFWRARIAAILGQNDQAVALLQDTFAKGFHNWYYDIPYYEIMDFENLRDYEPFRELIKPKK
ncbi:MAG: hypothetical protein KQI35_16630 [Bacteroidetes bacterium]|nr:hypothetical protein [Bacteroidota bacterium]